MMIIGIIGPKGTGKDTLANYLADKYEGQQHAHSEILYQILQILHLPSTRDNAIKLVKLRNIFGKNALIDALNKRIERDHAELEFITGIRFENEYNNIRSYPTNKIIYISAPVELRFQWQQKRNQRADDASMSFVEFIELEKRETEIYIKELGNKADYKIENIGSEAELFAAGDKIMQQILNKDIK